MGNGAIHHALAHLVRLAPGGTLHVLLEFDRIFFAFLLVDVLGGAAISSECFIVAYMGRVAAHETAKERGFHNFGFLCGKGFGSAVSEFLRIERPVLPHHLGEGLVFE